MDELELRIIESVDELCTRESAWDQLWERSDVTAPSARARIVSLWIDCFARGAMFRALLVEQQGRLVGALPLVGRRFLSMVRAGMLPGNVWASNGDLLIEPNADIEAVLDRMVSGFDLLPWRLFVFEQVPFEEPRWLAFRSALKRAGISSSVLEQHRVGQVEISSDWKAYEATRKARHRQRRRRNARMLEEAGCTELKVHAGLDHEDVDRLLSSGFEVEERSWKGRTGTAVLRNKEIFNYYLKEARQLATWGQLELVFLEQKDVPIAFCYGWNAKGVRFCVKVGFDDAYAKYGPGQQQMMRLLERIHADPQCTLYDFHGRLVPWTESWITGSYKVGRLVVAEGGCMNKVLCNVYTRLHPMLKRARRKILTRFRAID